MGGGNAFQCKGSSTALAPKSRSIMMFHCYEKRFYHFCRFRNIFVLHTFDSEGNLDQFIREATVMNQTTGEMNFIEFVGPGPMTIIGRHAYFQLFAIDPRVSP